MFPPAASNRQYLPPAGGCGRSASAGRAVLAGTPVQCASGAHTGVVRITVRVRPRAVDGQATAAALAAVAAAFGVRRPAVTLIAGASSRTKIIDVAGADP